MEKILTISIASYNVEKYIEKTLNSLIIDNIDLLEVLVIIDGSKDKTMEIAKKYEKKFPGTFRVIYKENGGYGSTINTGIENAKGKYFKQLDGDDWYNTENLNQLCLDLKNIDVDVVYSSFIEHNDKTNEEKKIKCELDEFPYENILENIISKVDKRITMHSLMFKTKLLKENDIKIQEHCFYTDTEYVFYPLIYSKTIYVFKDAIYVYRVGNEGQSVSRKGRLKHYNDILQVGNRLLNETKRLEKISPNLRKYLEKYLSQLFSVTIGGYLILLPPTKENYNLIKEFDNKILETNKEIYNNMDKYSKLVKKIRKANYFSYKILYYLKKVKFAIKE